MTLGIGYQGRDFAAILSDSMEKRADGYPQLNGKIRLATDSRHAYVLSGWRPSTSCDVSGLSAPSAARKLYGWMLTCEQEMDGETGRGFEVLVVGGPRGHSPQMCMYGRGIGMHYGKPGDVFFIGCRSPRARDLGLERNVGALTPKQAGDLLLQLAGLILGDLLGEFGCSSAADFAIKMPGFFPNISEPFHLALMSKTNAVVNSYRTEVQVA